MRSIFEYRNYREFLSDYYLSHKAAKSGITYARFSAVVGVKSPNLLKQVMDGSKNLTAENAKKFALGMKLSEEETDYFETLVVLNQSRNLTQREYFEERLNQIKRDAKALESDTRRLSSEEFRAINDWKHWTLMTLATLPGFEENGSWLSQRLFGFSTPAQTQSMLATLIRLKILKRDVYGRLRQSSEKIKTTRELEKSSFRSFYEGVLTRALGALDVKPDEREFACAFVGISSEQLPELKRKVRAFAHEIHAWAQEKPRPTQVYMVNLAVFPATSVDKQELK